MPNPSLPYPTQALMKTLLRSAIIRGDSLMNADEALSKVSTSRPPTTRPTLAPGYLRSLL